MRRATEMAPAGAWPIARSRTTVTLDYEARHRRRVRLACDDGSHILLDLEKAVALRHGDGLRLADDEWISVRAASEDLVEIRCATSHELVRIAWHLGNRHCPADLQPGRILIRRDHVIEEMLCGLGATVTPVREAFDPARGAYDHGGHHHDG